MVQELYKSVPAKRCPECKTAQMYLKYKYSVRGLTGSVLAATFLMIASVVLIYLINESFVPYMIVFNAIIAIRRASREHFEAEKKHYWHCYRCENDYHDKSLMGKFIYRSERTTNIFQQMDQALKQKKLGEQGAGKGK